LKRPVTRSAFHDGLEKLRLEASKALARSDQPRTLLRSEIKVESAVFQPRVFGDAEDRDGAHVSGLVSALKAKPAGSRLLDDVVVVAIGASFYCIDGHHRLMAYAAQGVEKVPVEHFDGDLEEAVREAIKRNSRDRLPMTNEAKLESAWRLVLMEQNGGASKREIAQDTGVSERTIATMRAVLRTLPKHRRVTLWPTWNEAKGLGNERRLDFSDEDREAQVREWAKRLRKAFGKSVYRQADVFADALEMYSPKLPKALVQQAWSSIARDYVQEFPDDE
jgi:hypothetical protein